MADEDTVLQEAMDNLKEVAQRIRATQSLMRSQGMTDGENHRDLLTRLSAALAMTEAAYLERPGAVGVSNRPRNVFFHALRCIRAKRERAGAVRCPSPQAHAFFT